MTSSLRRSVVVTAMVSSVGATLLGAGCTTIEVEDTVACPTTAPAGGSSCEASGFACSYLDECDQKYLAICDDASWDVQVPTDECPPDDGCPAQVPKESEPCTDFDRVCTYYPDEYDFMECNWLDDATCTVDGWQVTTYPNSEC